MRQSLIPKIALFAILLSLSGCKKIADPPEHWLCQYNGTPRAFYCVHSETGERRKVAADDRKMKAAQCLSAGDYGAMQDYIDYLIQEARRRCQ